MDPRAPFPTPYPGVNAVLLDFAARTRAILGDQLLGFYLYGSLALGDFDPETSDIDWIVVTQGQLPEDRFEALQALHADFERRGSPWAKRVEAAYIPLEALNHPAATRAAYPQVERGTALLRAPLEAGWAFQRYALRRHGIAVAGPRPDSLVNPVDPADMRRAAQGIVKGWLDQSQHDPDWIAWVRERQALSFVALTLCRMLYSLATGQVASKPAAARWAQAHTGGRWDDLLRRSLAGQQDHGQAPESDLQEMLSLLAYVLEQSQVDSEAPRPNLQG